MTQIKAVELTARHDQYMAECKKAWNNPQSRGSAAALIKKARDDYAAWFAERGVELIFS
jgi:hypothetical protein